MTFWQKVRLFFSPVKSNYTWYVLLFLYSVIIALANIFFVIFLEKIAVAVEVWNADWIKFWSIGLWWLALMNYLIRILLKPHHFKLWRDWLQYLEKEYFGKYLQLDNNEAEKIGTWRFISIMQKWIDTWQEEVVLVFWDKTVLSVGIVVSLFYIAQSSVLFLLFILWIAVFAIPRISFFGKKAIVLRRKSKGYQTEKKYTVWKNWYNAKFKEKIRQWLWYDTIVFLAKCFVVVIAFFVWKWAIDWTYTLSDFVLLTGLWSILKNCEIHSILWEQLNDMKNERSLPIWHEKFLSKIFLTHMEKSLFFRIFH